jgi:hypothetical protein
MFISLVSSVFGVEKPSGYNSLVVNKNSISSYQSDDGKIYVIDTPLYKFSLDFSSIGIQAGTNEWGNKLFYTKKYCGLL